MPDDLPLSAKAEELINALRPIGLYENQAAWVPEAETEEQAIPGHTAPPGRHILVLDLLVGDHAFSDGVQAPEQIDFDAELSLMTKGLETAEDREIREEIDRARAEGRNPFQED